MPKFLNNQLQLLLLLTKLTKCTCNNNAIRSYIYRYLGDTPPFDYRIGRASEKESFNIFTNLKLTVILHKKRKNMRLINSYLSTLVMMTKRSFTTLLIYLLSAGEFIWVILWITYENRPLLCCCSVFEGALSDHIPVVHTSIAGCRIIGRMCAGLLLRHLPLLRMWINYKVHYNAESSLKSKCNVVMLT